jgi:hypothetical protein
VLVFDFFKEEEDGVHDAVSEVSVLKSKQTRNDRSRAFLQHQKTYPVLTFECTFVNNIDITY